ncbi:hypothetical protein V1527DRAFT_522330 [Lipomyces starkeyi]
MNSIVWSREKVYGKSPRARQAFIAEEDQTGPADRAVEVEVNASVVGHAGYNMIDDDEEIVLDTGCKVHCHLQSGQVVFCPLCETDWREWFGKRSLYPAPARLDRVLIFQLHALDRCDIVRGPINWNGGQDISFDDGDYRLFFLDAPLGTGKSHAVREYLRANPGMSILSIMFRQPLARYLANELGLECYLNDGFFADQDRMRRCVICMDSIHKLRPIIISLAVITHTLLDVMTTFQRFLHNSRRCICLQHRIPYTTISFFMNCMDLRAGTNDVIKRKVSAPTVLHPVKVLTSPNGVAP